MKTITINSRSIGNNRPVYIVAEMSANHNQEFEQAARLVAAAKEAGADAIKLQTYTPDTLTIDCDNKYFNIKGSIWQGKTLYDLYQEAFTPWDWQPKLSEIATKHGLDCFSTPFDHTAVEFLETLNVPAYKVASFEIVDLPLIRRIAATGKPLIMSTGMSSEDEIRDAVQAFRQAGGSQLALLKCTSAYPATPESMNLRTISHMIKTFDVPIGISDHTLGIEVSMAAVVLGACIVEKHLTLSRRMPGPDSAFSLEPGEFKKMVDSVRVVEETIGTVKYGPCESEKSSRVFRRSLFVVNDIRAGEHFSLDNVRSIRPGFGLPPKYLEQILQSRAKKNLKRGTPLSWDMIEET